MPRSVAVPGESPGMDMEHRGNRHIDIAAMEAVRRFHRAEPGQYAHGVKHKLAVGIGNRLRIARGAGGVEGGGPAVLLEIRKNHIIGRCRHDGVIAGDEGEIRVRLTAGSSRSRISRTSRVTSLITSASNGRKSI